MDIETRTLKRVTTRLVPFLILCYFVAYLDRVNVAFASLTMNKDLGLSSAAYGFGAGVFFLTYAAFEVPSNLILERVGARRWIARIMVTWGLISAMMAFIPQIAALTGLDVEYTFYGLRMLLGLAEAGFFPGVIFFLTLWFPTTHRARVTGYFMSAIPLAGLFGSPASGLLLQLNGWHGLAGWQWMFIIEAVPALLLSAVVLMYLTDMPSRATWLDREQKLWLNQHLQREAYLRLQRHKPSVAQAILNPKILLLGFIYFGAVASRDSIGFFLPQIVKEFGLTNVETGFVAAIPFLIGAVGMILWGRHSDRTNERKAHVAIPLVLAAAGLAASTVLPDPILKMVALCVANFGVFACLPPFWTLPTAYLTGAAAAGGIAAINTVGQLGGFYAPAIIGWVKQTTGSFNLGLVTVAVMTLFAALIVMLLRHDEASVTASATEATVPAE